MKKGPGSVYVISGPSGAGKSTIIAMVRKKITDLAYSVSHTSRKPRGKEVNGVDYHFVDRATFMKMIDDGVFLEWARVYDDFYGTSLAGLREQLDKGHDVLMDLDSQGAENVRKNFKEAVLIYILPPSLAILAQRLKKRATDEDHVVQTRLSKAAEGFRECLGYDFIIINDDVDKAAGAAESIILSRRRRQPQAAAG